MLRWTSSREPAVQTCPWLKKIAPAAPSTAIGTGQSPSTTTGLLPPSSRLRRFIVAAARRWMSCPTSVDPVKAILSTWRCSTSAMPAAAPPVTMLTTPAGNPASAIKPPR
jgi:hypothetical protein